MAQSSITRLLNVSCAIVWLFSILGIPDVSEAFSSKMPFLRSIKPTHSVRLETIPFILRVSSTSDSNSQRTLEGDDDGDVEMSDEDILQQTEKSQLVDLCKQFSLDTKGTKEVLLKRLRDFAAEQAELERKRLEARRQRVEEGSSDGRERFEFLEGDDLDDDQEEEAFFYYPTTVPDPKIKEQVGTKTHKMQPVEDTNSQARLTAPPPPPIEPDENGERVVTVYSTTDMNDLTGVAAAQPGQAAQNDPMIAGGIPDPINAPWDTNNPQKVSKDVATTDDIERAKAEISDLVSALLAMTGAPGFQQDDDDDDNDELASLLGENVVRRPEAFASPEKFSGFDPSTVPSDMLTRASTSLRIRRGTVLTEVLREFELRAIGYDGAAGDDIERGGGHYSQVSKVRSFLEGFRRAEVRRRARETATLLLDKLVSEGIEGLDIALATMTRSSDETGDEAGELNDSLLDYLNEIIRQQEKKVDQVVDSVKKIEELENSVIDAQLESDEDTIEKLWSVEADEDGRIETFDPNSKSNQAALKKELDNESQSLMKPIAPKSAPEQLLLLLTLLRERVKTEATFSHDEKSRNLRVLAYCLNLQSDDLRRELISREFGASLDRLDSFAELVASSIEYAASTSHQLQPSRQGPLNLTLLKRIEDLTKNIRDTQSWKASGARTPKLNS